MQCIQEVLYKMQRKKYRPSGLSTLLSRFLVHAPLSEHAPLLEYRHAEVNCNII